jgi:hypothetical protein
MAFSSSEVFDLCHPIGGSIRIFSIKVSSPIAILETYCSAGRTSRGVPRHAPTDPSLDKRFAPAGPKQKGENRTVHSGDMGDSLGPTDSGMRGVNYFRRAADLIVVAQKPGGVWASGGAGVAGRPSRVGDGYELARRR